MFSCEYCKIFKSTYFEKQLQTAASVHSVSKLKKCKMENIKLRKSDDLVSQIFRTSPSEMHILFINIFKFQENVSRKVFHHLKGSIALVNGYFWQY